MTVISWLYIISVSFQLSGAVLLLIKHTFVSINKRVIENKLREPHVENETLIIEDTQPSPSETAENIWLNRISFALIALGYLIGVWGVIDNSQRLEAFIWIILLSTVIVIFLDMIILDWRYFCRRYLFDAYFIFSATTES